MWPSNLGLNCGKVAVWRRVKWGWDFDEFGVIYSGIWYLNGCFGMDVTWYWVYTRA